MKVTSNTALIAGGIFVLLMIIGFAKLSLYMVVAAAGVGLVSYSVSNSTMGALGATAITLLILGVVSQYYKAEGFNTNTPPGEISKLIRKMKNSGLEGFRSADDEEEEEEGFEGDDEEEEEKIQLNKMKEMRKRDKEYKSKEGFAGNVFQNISKLGYNVPGFGMSGPHVEGYEDVKREKDAIPAPASKNDTMPMPFKLGEIPSQIKNGPHIDAGSTLMKAIQNLNPDQINAMTKDTQQLIETQKSLMSMLGTMKPMLNDGKELMNTFQQMFGQ